ncbi:MAG: hypothetical protein Q8867_11440 [Bacteroidota bacterium]|nr:hypothetical protein [Bacteroidota bacterium]
MIQQIPGRTLNDDPVSIDISQNYFSFLENDIEIVYSGIESGFEEIHDQQSFFKGNQISWDELSKNFDVKRDKTDCIIEELDQCARLSKGVYVVELCHKPGGGGTTVARRVAYELHREFPIIIISKYHKEKTADLIFQMAEMTRKPVIAVIEAHSVSKNELNLLIRSVNSDKKHLIIFPSFALI